MLTKFVNIVDIIPLSSRDSLYLQYSFESGRRPGYSTQVQL